MTLPAIWIDGSNPAATSYDTWSDVPAFFIDNQDDLDDAFQEGIDQQRRWIVLQGDDAFVALVVTRHHRIWAKQGAMVHFVPMNLGTPLCTVANQLNIPDDSKKAARQCFKAIRRKSIKTTLLPTMTLRSNLATTSTLAFHIGLGELVPLMQRRQRTPLGGVGALISTVLKDISSSSSSDTVARFVVDHTPREAPGFMLLSSLQRSWFDLSMGAQSMAYRDGDSLLGLTQSIARSQVPLAMLRSDDTVRSFQMMSWDGRAPYMVDGSYFSPQEDEVCMVDAGPNAPFAHWR